MLRGYRCIVVASLGCLILCGQATKGHSANLTNSEAKRLPVVAPSPVEPIKTVQPSEYERPCDQDRENRNSDLCAQWKAADAASKTVFWAMLQFWIGLAGVVGLLISLHLTRKAVLATAKGTEAAQKSAEAAVAAVHTERAWLTPASLEVIRGRNVILDGKPHEEALLFVMHWKNTGRSPGIVAWTTVHHRVGPRGSEPPNFDVTAPVATRIRVTVAPNAEFHSAPLTLGNAEMSEFMDEKTSVFVYSKIAYFDVFDSGRLRITEAFYKAQRNGSFSENGVDSPRFMIGATGLQNSAT